MTEFDPSWLLAERRDGISFMQCLQAASANAELVKEFDRLRGTNLSLRGSPIDLAVDEATGRLKAELQLFTEFVFKFVFLRIPLQAEAVVSSPS